MTQITDDPSAQLILKQVELVALEVARAEAIVDHALGAAAMAMAAKGITGTSELTEYAKEILQVARNAAAKVLQVAKKEAHLTLELANKLASERLDKEYRPFAESAPMQPPTH